LHTVDDHCSGMLRARVASMTSTVRRLCTILVIAFTLVAGAASEHARNKGDADAGTGASGAACSSANDCATGMCVDVGAGNVCTTSCTSDADCPDNGHCVDLTTDAEFPLRVCQPGPAADDTCSGPMTDPDLCCSDDNPIAPFLPYMPLTTPQLPADCHNGFELNNGNGFVYNIVATTTAGSRLIALDFQVATYDLPNRIRVYGKDANGEMYVLFDHCRFQTSGIEFDRADTRPPDTDIRQLDLDVRPGTRELFFDFTDVGSTSPFYIRVLGLCDFNIVHAWPSDATKAQQWRTVE
jgi:hypothetical protein